MKKTRSVFAPGFCLCHQTIWDTSMPPIGVVGPVTDPVKECETLLIHYPDHYSFQKLALIVEFPAGKNSLKGQYA